MGMCLDEVGQWGTEVRRESVVLNYTGPVEGTGEEPATTDYLEFYIRDLEDLEKQIQAVKDYLIKERGGLVSR